MSNKEQLDPYSPGGCFIATACYGSEFTEEVLFLKDFRDEFLTDFSIGQKFIENYYRYSPPIADFLKRNEFLRSLSRLLLVEPFYLASKGIMKVKELFE
ncbi:MAG: CFI-box-CTERM domain-containing protein [Candidatus Aenigmatarchaeota archaeon]